VGDPANDAFRISANDVRARVIGEGANLGMTQAARIEFALQGGRVNTDFIDNSAGVDCSDNEVNIKIALASAKRAGRLDEDGRVAAVQHDRGGGPPGAGGQPASGAGPLDRRARRGAGRAGAGAADRRAGRKRRSRPQDRRARPVRRLCPPGGGRRRPDRPELAVLLSSAKLVLQRALEESPVVDDPVLEEELLAAFPQAMRERFETEIVHHRLRREIIATKLANRIVNRLGPVHPFEMAEGRDEPRKWPPPSSRPSACSAWRNLGHARYSADGRALRLSLFERDRARAARPRPMSCARATARSSPMR
jgi:glutamate dehydrogenase